MEMAIGTILSAVLMAQAGPAAIREDASGQADAAYEQLAAGENEQAIAHLEAALEKDPLDVPLAVPGRGADAAPQGLNA